MDNSITIKVICELGFDWLKFQIIEENCVIENNEPDLFNTVEKLQLKKAYYKKQINNAYKFKIQQNADYSDFTNNFDQYVKKEHQLNQAIIYIEKIIEVAKNL